MEKKKKTVKPRAARRRVDVLYAKIKKAEDDIKCIRETCPHDTTHLGEYAWALSHQHLAVICDECDEHVRVASAEENATYYNIKDAKFIVISPYNPLAN